MTFDDMYESERQALLELRRQVVREVDDVMTALGIKAYPGKPFSGERYLPRSRKNKALQQQSQQRLLIWLQWSRRFRVSLSTIVRMVVIEFRRRYRKTEDNLGIPIANITGASAEAYLEDKLKTVPTSPLYQELPAKYNSIEDRVDQMRQMRLANKKNTSIRRYRNGPNWKPVAMDVVRKEMT